MPSQAYCAHCCEPLPKRTTRGRPLKYCNAECRNAARVRPPPIAADLDEKDCVVCGKRYRPRQRNQRFCSRHCYDHRPWDLYGVKPRKVREHRDCPTCGQQFPVYSDHQSQTYCSRSCGCEGQTKAWPANNIYPHRCPVCSKWFTARRANRHLCSDFCCQLANNHSLEELHRQLVCRECGNTWHRWERPGKYRFCSTKCQQRNTRRTNKKVRRARLRQVENEGVDLAVLAERDGWRCHICRKKVDRTNWSIDHLIPLSDLGPHTYVNTALAHHWCNTVRSNTGSAQLRLTG